MRKIFFCFVIAVMLAACSDEGARDKKAASFARDLKAGDAAIDFLYKDMDGRPFRLSEQKGKVVILYFWRMKCAECKAEMESLEALNGRFKDRGLVVVAVGADTMHSSPIGDVRDFLKAKGFTFINIRDSEGFVAEAYSIIFTPHTFVIDGNGVVADVKKVKTDWMSPESVGLIESLTDGMRGKKEKRP